MDQQTVLFTNKSLGKMIIPPFSEQLLVMLVGLADTLIISYAGEAASQLLAFSTVFALLIAILVLIEKERMLGLLFGKVDQDVMEACVTYLRISAYSYPSLIARTFSAVAITWLCFQEKNEVVYRCKWIFRWNGSLMKRILNIAIPNGLENGIFQLVKVALSSIVALFGTYQIAANGVAQSIWSMAALAGVSMGPVFITVIGQCMGTKDTVMAEYYFKKLTRITLLLSSVWNLFVFLITPAFLGFYALETETKQLVIRLVLIHNLFNAVAYPFSGALSNGLRAAGDVKFTMYVSVLSTIVVRLLLSYILGITLQMGVIGIAIAMVCDWCIRAVIFIRRQKSGKWKTFCVI